MVSLTKVIVLNSAWQNISFGSIWIYILRTSILGQKSKFISFQIRKLSILFLFCLSENWENGAIGSTIGTKGPNFVIFVPIKRLYQLKKARKQNKNREGLQFSCLAEFFSCFSAGANGGKEALIAKILAFGGEFWKSMFSSLHDIFYFSHFLFGMDYAWNFMIFMNSSIQDIQTKTHIFI